MSKVRRALSVVCLLLFLGLPLTAQTQRQPVPLSLAQVRERAGERVDGIKPGFLEALWERLSAPIVSLTELWEADGGEDLSGSPEPTSRGPWDPNG